MTSPIDYYFVESGSLEFIVGSSWRPRIPVSKLGTSVSLPTLTITRITDGADVTGTWFPGGTLSVAGGYVVVNSPIQMLAKGDYHLTFTYNVDGATRKDRLVIRVDE